MTNHHSQLTTITKLRIAILGTRGIPNRYGGFEQVAAYLSAGLVSLGHNVTVYCPSTHPYKQENWNGVKLIHCLSPDKLGSAAQFVYDLYCTLDARKRDFDIWLILGYTSSSVWGWLYPKKKTVLVSNMDGLEWKRSKYSRVARRFLQFAEKLAVKHSHFLVADSLAIREYLQQKYGVRSKYIAYGAEVTGQADEHELKVFGLQSEGYFLAIARMEPENNIGMILEGFVAAHTGKKLVLIGNINNAWGRYWRKQFEDHPGILFIEALYDPSKLTALRTYCSLYFHGHSCGGTNPSLLEAMGAGAMICAHDNAFNRAILGEDAQYFQSGIDVRHCMETVQPHSAYTTVAERNIKKIREEYNWPAVVATYERFMIDCFNSMNG